MIELTRLSNAKVIINADLIERVEAAPDTLITLITGSCFIVKESTDEVVEKIVEYKASLFQVKVPSPPHPLLTVIPTERP
jgi:flagellar protein FlbD